MAGTNKAVKNGAELQSVVMALGVDLGLKVERELNVGRRIWGSKRRIDVVLTQRATGLKLGIECKFQGCSGSAEEKIPSTIQDIKVWPIKGIVVIAGAGFSPNMRGFLMSTGMVVDYEDLVDWLRLYFSL